MVYRRLGRAGLKISVVGLGTWLTCGQDRDRDRAVVAQAVESGINYFETANTDARGAAEESLGAALREHPDADLVVSTKAWGTMGPGPNQRGLSRKALREQCEASLRRLGRETIDLYWLQRFDPEVTLDEIVATMADLVHAGKIHYWGVCGWDDNQVHNAAQLADGTGRIPLSAYQARYNLLDREAESAIFPTCWQRTLGVLAYSPLAQGVLTTKYAAGPEPPVGTRLADERRGRNARDRYGDKVRSSVVYAVQETAWTVGATPAQVALAYTIRSGAATAAVFGATSPEQVRENAGAADVVLEEGLAQRLEWA